jgi:peptidoglycan hydrolase CwlO-like protein
LKRAPYRETLEFLVTDLIFKLGKANEKIHSLAERVYRLEKLLHDQQRSVGPSNSTLFFLEKE